MIQRWSSGDAQEHMDESILTELAPRIERHPWWVARARLTMALLRRLGIKPPASILDAGCGWGVTLWELERKGYKATGLDVSQAALQRLDGPMRNLVEADLTRDWPRVCPTFDAVLALDVIEHLDDDRSAVAILSQRVAPGGCLIVSVPAIPDLFSEFDEIQGHRRRYLPETLRAAFSSSGLEVQRVFWWGQWLVNRLRKGRSKPRAQPGDTTADIYGRYLALPPWPASIALSAFFALELNRALDGKLTTGTSLFAVARRPTALP